MLNNIIKYKTKDWLQSPDCNIKHLIQYISTKGELRKTQIEAIEIYLFLKIQGQNKPLWKLFAENFFYDTDEISQFYLKHPKAINYMETNSAAKALFHFAIQKNAGKMLLPELANLILQQPENIEYEKIIKSIFYNVNYADYLMSLPMGAGKTFLMAAFIYLDLYFADLEQENKSFAHNFLILIPSGLKSSIIPSLKTIENFNPAWVLPEPAATKIKNLLNFEILDQPKTAKKSNKAENPNAQKVNQCLPAPFGRVFVVNAEKVILNRLELSQNLELIEKTEEEKDKFANELRNLIGKIPNLSILIDEVHHAATDDVKLRQVVNRWSENGNITTVLGFSGTPYLSKADKIKVTEDSFFKFSQITNTVYYYPLTTAIENFLKTPRVKVAENLDKFQIIEKGIADFNENYKDKIYNNGTIPKIAIFCTSIQALEEEIFPFLTSELKIKPEEILKFHRGNKEFKLLKENELEFNSLDLPLSKKRYILLVQIGKEGWDCRSLTSIILSQKGDSPKNMVLQTSCRCLRQVDKDKHETARIWLNEYNAKILNSQLKKEQNTSIEELNKLNRISGSETVERVSRIEHLNLPKIEFYQLKVNYNSIDEEETANTKEKLENIIKNIENFKSSALIKSSNLSEIENAQIDIVNQTGIKSANFNQWIFEVSKQSFNKISLKKLNKFEVELFGIFEKITYKKDDKTVFNELFDLYKINSKIRVSFNIKRRLQTTSEIIKENADLLIVEKLNAVEKNEKLFPNEKDIKKIIELDESKKPTKIDDTQIKNSYDVMKKSLEQSGMENMIVTFEQFKSQFDYSLPVKQKDKTFHYLPYNFVQSGFEKDLLTNTLKLNDFNNSENLEIYYNGERGLTDFVINCFAKEGKYWKNIGKYTTDFLIIKRKDNEIYKALLIETKGEGFKNDESFLKKKKYVETDFLEQNKKKFGYEKFDFLYLEDSSSQADNIIKLNNKINEFFKD